MPPAWDGGEDGAAGGSAGDGGSAGTDAGGGTAGDEASTDAPPDTKVDSDAQTNPCEGMVCNKPPAKECADADNLKVYNATGTCSEGLCSYSFSTTPCPQGCENGACKNDPCLGVTCNSPPAKFCSDPTHLSVYDVPGTCTNGDCSYTTHEEYCGFGCDNAACKGDPCVGVTCNQPPASFCSDPDNLVVYEVPGKCTNGVCAYTNHEQFCSFGCENGACKGDPCAGVTCNQPPAAFCAGPSTLRTFAATGTCNQGSCGYTSTDVPCAHGCVSGACNECVNDSECGAGKWCSSQKCVACTQDQHCGASCTDCSAIGQVCAAGACACPANTKLCAGSCVALNLPQSGCSNTGSCSPCPLPAFATATDCSGAGQTCSFTCDAALHRVKNGASCDCDSAGHWTESGGVCVCASGYVPQGNTCVPACTGTSANGFCYWYVSTAAAFDAAEAACVSQGGHLASITSQAENDTVKALAVANAWFGLRDPGTSQTASTSGDDCTDIIVANAAGGTYSGSTSSAYDDIGPCSKTSNGAKDKFFKLTITTQWTWVFSTSGSNFDTYLGLYNWTTGSSYTGCVGGFIACDDDSGSNYTSRVIRNLAPGTYLINVDGSSSSEYGSLSLHLRRFEFTDGTVHNYQNWSAKEPSNSSNNERCTEMISSSGAWNDLSCTATHPYVCKKPL